MFFLDFNLFKLETWLSSAANGIMGTILSGIRTMFFYITSIIYELLVNVYNLFEKLCSARILDNKVIEVMAQRIGVILGLIMFFYIIFSFIQMLINPEKLEDKEKGAVQIVKKAILVVVMLGVSTFFFEAAFGLQTKIIESNIIGKLLIPYNIEGLEDDNFGNLLSVNLMRAFYHINPDIANGDVKLKDKDKDNYDDCKGYLMLFYDEVYKYNRYDLGNTCLNSSVDVKRVDSYGREIPDQVYVIDFNGIIAPIVGGFAVYLMLTYCFKIGVRLIQLAFFEIISPMAIVSYLSPKKDNMFTKWWKIYFATYIDVFIRIAIINLVIFLICTIYSTDTAGGNLIFWESLEKVGVVESEKWFFSVVIVLSLLTFAKKAPDLLKELLPASASKLGFGPSMKDIVGLKETIGMTAGVATASAVGLIGGAAGGKGVLGKFTGAFGGLAGGMFRGGKAGFGAKGIGKAMSSARDAQAKANLARAQRIASGSTLGERIGDATRGAFGIQSGYDKLNAEIAMSNDVKSTLEKEDVMRHIDEVKQSYIQAKAQRGEIVDYNDLIKFDEAKKSALESMYLHAYSNDSGPINFSFHLPDVNGGTIEVKDEFKSNQGIYNKIHENEKRARKTLDNYERYKADNNDLKNRIANKHKNGK